MNDNGTVSSHLGSEALAGGGDGLAARQASARRGRGRALFVEALSLSFAREDHRAAAQRLRALADRDTQVLTLALVHCAALLHGPPEDPGISGALRLLASAIRPVEDAA